MPHTWFDGVPACGNADLVGSAERTCESIPNVFSLPKAGNVAAQIKETGDSHHPSRAMARLAT
jgi:hypothetical protein